MDTRIRKWNVRNLRRVPIGIRINGVGIDFAVGQSRVVDATEDQVKSYFDPSEWSVSEIVEQTPVAPEPPKVQEKASEPPQEPQNPVLEQPVQTTETQEKPKKNYAPVVVPQELVDELAQNKAIMDNQVVSGVGKGTVYSEESKKLIARLGFKYGLNVVVKATGIKYERVSNCMKKYGDQK